MVQTAAGDFIKAIITISANASQNEQQCIGPNELTRQLVSKPCVEQLIGYMLGGGNPLTVGVGIVIEVIRKNNSDYDPDMGTEANAVPSSRDPIYLGTLLRLFAQNVPKFMTLIMDIPSQKNKIDSTFGDKLEPLGFDRFKTCELMAELLHCSNMGLLNEPGSEEMIATRDAERQRLRNEGKLGPLKEEDPSIEDLTMRRSHAEPKEVRRLEVTNADDDGFEEVEPSKEMSEDTSHEFVKAEDDIPPVTASSLLDKDDDEFVEEPLSSPRLAILAEKINEQTFEDPDLVVAPLSPTKPKPAEAMPTEDSPRDKETEKKSTEVDPDVIEPLKISTSTNQDAMKDDGSDSSPVLTPTTSEPDIKLDTKDALNVESDSSVKPLALSPHPEDTPAPLFSAPPPPESGADKPPQKTEKIAAELRNDALANASVMITEGDTTIANEGMSRVGDETQPPQEGAASAEPVVGDYLKMQFVEYRVVPTILVSQTFSHTDDGSNLASHFSFHTPGTTSFIMLSTMSFNKSLMGLWIGAITLRWPSLCLKLRISPVPSSTARRPAMSPRPRPKPEWATWAT